MTAMNLFVQPDRAYLLTDTATYLDNGIIVGFRPKVCELHFGESIVGATPSTTAIAMTGCVVAADFAQECLSKFVFREVGDLLRLLPEIFQGFCSGIEHAKRAPGVTEKAVAVALATWVPGHGPSGWVIGNEHHPFPKEHYTPFKLMKIDQYVMRTGRKLPERNYRDRTQFDPVRDSGELLDAQRLDPFGTDEAPFFAIGGTGVLTEVSQAGVHYHAIRHWPDRVGEKIIP